MKKSSLSGVTRRLTESACVVLALTGCGGPGTARHVVREPTAAREARLQPYPMPSIATTASVISVATASATPRQADPVATGGNVAGATSMAEAPITGPRVLLDGVGEGYSEPFTLQPGPVLIQVHHPTDTFFAAFLLDAMDQHLALLGNASVAITGTQFVGVAVEGEHHLHVIAEDAWSAAVTQPIPPTSFGRAAPPAMLEGDGPAVSPTLDLQPGALRYSWSHSGTYPFTLTLWTLDGRQVGKVVYNGDVRQGTAEFAVPEPSAYLINLLADGPWRLEPIT